MVGARSRRWSGSYSEGIAITSSLLLDDVTRIEPVRYPHGIGRDVLALYAADRRRLAAGPAAEAHLEISTII
jgi:hypothetical protein